MKFGIRELTWLAVGLVMGAVVGVVLTLAASRLLNHALVPSLSGPEAATQQCFNTLLAATAADDYNQFVSIADDNFRARITPASFHQISQGLAPRMRAGYTPTYLGLFRQTGAQVSLWRVTFADGSDDRLVRMSLFQGQVDGFVIAPAF